MGATIKYRPDYERGSDERLTSMRVATISKIFFLCILGLSSPEGDATGIPASENDVSEFLPELPGEAASIPEKFNLDKDELSIAYTTPTQKWAARVDAYSEADRSFKLNYGYLFSSALGAGAEYSVDRGQSEVLMSGVYEPWKSIRIRFAGSQLRGGNLTDVLPEDQSSTLMQNNYLLSARKYWGAAKPIADLDATLYRLHAADTADSIGSGTSEGYSVAFGLMPTRQSRLVIRHEVGHYIYSSGDGIHTESALVQQEIAYSRDFDNCMQLRGDYSTSAESETLSLAISKNNWTVNITRASGNDSSIGIGYSFSLGKDHPEFRSCKGKMKLEDPARDLIAASLDRPTRFQEEPFILTGRLPGTEP